MTHYQTGIIDDLPAHGRYLTFERIPGTSPAEALLRLKTIADGTDLVVGVGRSLAMELNADLPNLGTFPALPDARIEVPSTPAALWCWLRGAERGALINRSRDLKGLLSDAFECIHTIDAFKHGSGRDLTDYEDGTENPAGQAAQDAAFLQGAGPGLDGSSCAAVQTWVHNLNRFKALSPNEQDRTIGRRLSDNEELADAPPSAHTKRTEKESFTPEAFMMRRSMPWADSSAEGLNFVAFGRDFRSFEVQLARMVGIEDGITDALFNFSRPVTGNYFWCPPILQGQLDLRALNL
ncbi:Dyp-type peroxidase [Pontiella agarivorans]|uniref:Dyp-type peroxidase n=1 Tax=Pontiella agarivorans TaxID=3038953 RepID=A0ABU5MZN0_9BACT|nr:Dyp-type peroxidase [Pontiella agarivorans]MDZ8119551.1 Dyp-type peroxidase [Pontiella agarivorans]